jgi:AcrR family transcriptional regulator
MDGYEKRTKLKMKNIEDATISLLHLELNDIKIADIAKKAAVSQVTIYNYYGSKEKLIEAVIRRLIEQQIQKFEEIIEADLPFTEKLKQVISIKKQTASQVHIYKLTDQDKRFYFTKNVPLFLKFIQLGRQSGYIRESVKDETLIIYLNLLEQAISHLDEHTVFPGGFEHFTEELSDLFLYGILNRN